MAEIFGAAGNDTLQGTANADLLNGWLGADKMIGGMGDDSYFVDNAGDVVTEQANGGKDAIVASVSLMLASNVEDVLLRSGANLNVTGNTADNTIYGNIGGNALSGGGGIDYLIGFDGDDILNGDAGNDILVGGDGNDLINGGDGNDVMFAGSGTNVLVGGKGDDLYLLSDGTDSIVELAGQGIDKIRADVDFNLGLYVNIENLELSGIAVVGQGNALNNEITGNDKANTLSGGDGNDILDGDIGKDTLVGGKGNDTYKVDDVDDKITEAAGEGRDLVLASVTYDLSNNPGQEIENLTLTGVGNTNAGGNGLANVITGNAGDNFMVGGGGNDTLIGGDGRDTLGGDAGNDVMIGGKGNDEYAVDSLADKITEAANEGVDTVKVFGAVNYALGANLEILDLFYATGNASGTGNSLDNTIYDSPEDNKLDGGAGNDTLQGLAGSNTLIGGLGDDTLVGGLGNDIMLGGAGNDTYFTSAGIDAFNEQAGQGIDTIVSDGTFALGAQSNIENLELIGVGKFNGIGNGLDNTIIGNDVENNLLGGAGNDKLFGNGADDRLFANDGNDQLDGGAGIDEMSGGKGNDTYYADSASEVVLEEVGEGTDLVIAAGNFNLNILLPSNLPSEIENLKLAGSGNSIGTGNDLKNVITGNDGNNILRGGKGDDTLLGGLGNDSLDGGANNDIMTGGKGNDFYYIDSIGDKVTEAANEGKDEVSFFGAFDYVLAANIEVLSLVNAIGNVAGTGNTLDNVITGNTGNNKLDGGAGNDTLLGGVGDDTLIGGAGNDQLFGDVGVNSLQGGAGNDTYLVGTGTDTFVELAGQGIDTVQSGKDYNLALFANFENLILTGAAVIGQGNGVDNSILGTAGANQLFGLAGNDTLDGGGGIDTLVGGIGNDLYRVDNVNDAITETAGQGTDRVEASSDYALSNNAGQEIENLTLTGTDDTYGDGNDLANVLTGNTGDNSLYGAKGNDTLVGGLGDDGLDGGEGNDLLIGGKGNDVYFIDSLADKVTEAANEGFDWVYVMAAINYTMAANLENLDLFYAPGDVKATGNRLDNWMTGQGGKNTLDGGAGNDSLDGSDGDDILIGGTGNDVMLGGAGFDTLIGGAGNDTYIVSTGGDVFTELAGQGIDTIQSDFNTSLNAFANFENVVLTGVAVNGIGNGLDNVITGNGADNILDGGSGNDQLFGGAGKDDLEGGDGNDKLDGGTDADTLNGGAGNDTYYVDSQLDVIFEGGGTDLVFAADSYDLAANFGQEIENLTLTGGSDFGYGNEFNNVITGTAGDNLLRGAGGNDTLVGGEGNDTLEGGTGNDAMTGGKGNDIYQVDSLADKVTEAANEGLDEVQIVGAISYTLGANLENLNLINASGAVNGTGNTLDNQILGNTSANTLDGGAGNDHLDGRAGSDTIIGGLGDDRLDGGTGDDILTGGLGNDTYVVDSTNDTINEFIGGGIDTVLSDVSFDLGFGLNGNVENLTLTGAGTSGFGNGLDNVITGTIAGNSLQGGEGQDTLYGKDGNDVLFGGLGNDILEGGLGVDTMRGDAINSPSGSDLFLYRLDNVGDLFNLGGDFITGFETGIDKIDVSDLLQDFNIDTVFANPYDPSDRFLSLVANGADTLIFFAPNGGAGMGANLLATVVNATVTEADVIY